ncbi:carboxylesterase 5A [Folsomia candida]|uniref:carboxylesterase 5A n=1 Tax=Folsomia candida TaxID=158441 RepID=UPI001605132D|nr:carboxylesterase 5A [Folsomia candida]
MFKIYHFMFLVFGGLAMVRGSPIADASNENKLTVKIDGLGAIRGKSMKTAETIVSPGRNVVSFTGIPYGTIPKRFSPAELRVPLTPSTEDVFDATQPQLACWQVASPLVPGPFTEDCLSLNIYTPKVSHGNGQPTLPVIFFIHGGSFVRWSGNMFDGRRLLNKDVVVVTINYRLNIFGFFCLENDQGPGNLGLYDQVLALNWVKKYIEHFGGDPNKITIAGQSAGGASVTFLLDSPMTSNNGLYHAAITSSGDDLAGWTIQAKPRNVSLEAAAVIGKCYNKDTASNDDETLQCLRGIPPADLIWFNSTFNGFAAPSVQSFSLSIPKVTPVSPYVALATNGAQSQVPLMIGSNKNDGSIFLSRIYSSFLLPNGLANNATYLKTQFVSDLLSSTNFGIVDRPLGILDTVVNTYLGSSKNTGVFSDIAPGLVDIFSVFYFKSAVFATAKGHSKFADTYVYSFDYEGVQTLYPYTGGVPQVPRGVAHIDDLMYLFFFGDFTSLQDKLMSTMMVDFWTNFATTKNPNGKSPLVKKWPKFTVDGGEFFKINTIPSVGSDYVNYWVDATD